MKKLFISLVAGAMLATAAIAPQQLVHAQGLGGNLDAVGEGAGLQDTPLTQTIGQIINIFLSVLGIIFLILVIYAGFLWMTAAGNDDKVSTAKKLLAQAVVGLVLILAAFAISNFVIDSLSTAGLAPAGGSGGSGTPAP